MPATPYQTALLSVLTTIAVASALWFAQWLFAPVLAALVLGVVFAPLTDRIERMGIPRVAGALIVLGGLMFVSLALFILIEPTISKAMRNAPVIWRELTAFLEAARQFFAGVEALQETVSEALSEETGASAEAKEDAPVEVPGLMDALALAPSVAAALMVFLGTLYFFLVARSDVYDHIASRSRVMSPQLFCEAERRVSRYYLTITVINAAFGTLVAIVMTLIGMTNPLLWGLAAFLVNFVLYLGPALFVLALIIAGIVQFDGAYSFFPALAYLLMNSIEGQFISPALVGRHMRVNPLLVFLSLVFWLWLWGPIGGVVAIPVLVWLLFVSGKVTEAGREGAAAAGQTARAC